VNDVFAQLIPRFSEKSDRQLLYVTGDKHFEHVRQILPARLPENVRLVPFIHDMPALLPHAGLLVCRAGSSTLAEICALGLASIIIPSPYVTANHQEENARKLADRGAARMLREVDLTPDSLWRALLAVLVEGKGAVMRDAARKLATPDAFDRLYRLVQSVRSQRTV
ncbi:MAG: undecaprenyldiphospho-muramoylpentapeptide beta-N-acetylglucosaminyltransferase, partial [Alicyclobacillus sp.]|nr:undecaprenyldiphospho-muramoylpentapeptide beta-N-acetylglucosaminyltransferase [Alicyclobacillus sp.]